MTFPEIKTVGVCGAGTMGSGIAQTAAMGGFQTLLYDVNEEVLQRARISIEKSLQSMVEKKKIGAAEKLSALERIRFVSEPQQCMADIIIEAIVEVAEAKLVALFHQLAVFNREDTLLADQYLFFIGHGPRRKVTPSRACGGPPFFQSRSADEAGGGGLYSAH